jgi:LuxR family maltose regulon positive regulatory protein
MMISDIEQTNIIKEKITHWIPATRKDCESLLLAGEYDLFLQLTDSIHSEEIRKNPVIYVYRSVAMIFSEYPKVSIYKELEKAEKLDQSFELDGEIIALRVTIKIFTEDPEKSIKQLQISLAKMSQKNIFFKNIIERNLGIAYTIKNDLNSASLWFEKLLKSSYSLGDWGGVLGAYNYLTHIRKLQGCLIEAGMIYRKALNFIDEKRLVFMPHSIKIIAGYGQLLLKWHKLDEAKSQLKRAIQLAKDTDIRYAISAYHNLSEAFLRENDTRSALSVIQELRHLIQNKPDLYQGIDLQQTQVFEARIHLITGKVNQAYDWLVSSGLYGLSADELSEEFGFRLGFILPIAALILIANGQTDEAVCIIETLIPQFLNQGVITHLIQSLSVLAVAYHQQEEDEKAVNALTRALGLAEPEDNLGDCLFIGHPLIPILSMIPEDSEFYSFAQNMIEVLSTFSLRNKPGQEEILMLTPLSNREIDVLNLIAEGMTNREIARELLLSTNTIKSHSNKIYHKLNVNDRNQAVSKARILGILPTQTKPLYSGYI